MIYGVRTHAWFILAALASCARTGKDSGTLDTSVSTDTAVDTGSCQKEKWYDDVDGDGFGDPASETEACQAPVGTIADGTDCDDTRADVYPGADETCRDGIVNDCDDTSGEAAIASCTGSGPFALSLADAKLIGEGPGDRAGSDLSGPGDLNGDGRDDLLLLALHHAPAAVYVVNGPVSGDFDLSGADARILSASEDDADTLHAATGVGDVDGDGFGDIALYAGDADVYLLFGAVIGEVGVGDAEARLAGEGDDSTVWRVMGLGDADGNGLADVLIGTPLSDGLDVESEVGACAREDEDWPHGESAGGALLFLNPSLGVTPESEADAKLWGEDGGDDAGMALARPGDLDGDGYADLFLSAPYNCEGGDAAGAAYVVLSPVSGDVSLADADAKLVGRGDGANVGTRISSAGDTNDDGTPDLIVSDPDADASSADLNAGAMYLSLGPFSGSQSVYSADATFVGAAASYAGESISSAGDVDADGYDDIVIGAWGVDSPGTDAGGTFILYGPLSGSYDLMVDSDTIFVGRAASYSGLPVAGVGDVDSDGLSDVLVGAQLESEGTMAPEAGAAYLLLGGGALLNGNGEI